MHLEKIRSKTIADKEQLKLLLSSAIEYNECKNWNTWREHNSSVEINLEEARLTNLNLKGVNLEKANLKKANLKYTDLQEAYLVKANLEEASLQGTDLEGACLQWARLKKAKLQNANLQETMLEGSNLQKADLYEVINLTAKQISECKRIEGILYLSKEISLELVKMNPDLMLWWQQGMIKEIAEVSILTDEEGWTGQWILPSSERNIGQYF